MRVLTEDGFRAAGLIWVNSRLLLSASQEDVRFAEWEIAMSMHDHSHSEGETSQGSFLTSRAGLVFNGFAVIAGALLFTEHRAHVVGLLIWLPLLACPLMHVFMHHGHGGHGGHSQQNDERKTP